MKKTPVKLFIMLTFIFVFLMMTETKWKATASRISVSS